jgi:hypothetical protein
VQLQSSDAAASSAGWAADDCLFLTDCTQRTAQIADGGFMRNGFVGVAV